MKLYLIRHGEAVSEQVDHERPLSEFGHREVEKVARFLVKKGAPGVNKIIHSGKKRAEQTAQIIKEIFSPQSQFIVQEGLSPNDPVEPIFKMIQESQQDLMIVGHLPSLSRLASKLVVGKEEKEIVAFHTGTVVALEKKSGRAWAILFSMSPSQIPT